MDKGPAVRNADELVLRLPVEDDLRRVGVVPGDFDRLVDNDLLRRLIGSVRNQNHVTILRGGDGFGEGRLVRRHIDRRGEERHSGQEACKRESVLHVHSGLHAVFPLADIIPKTRLLYQFYCINEL